MPRGLLVRLSCPSCQHEFSAKEVGGPHSISSIDRDLRELGGIESSRCNAVASCPSCQFSDFVWDFDAPLDESAATLIHDALESYELAPDTPPALRPFLLAQQCFAARGMDLAARAELALVSYYVACDTDASSLVIVLEQAAVLLAEALQREADPSPLSLRYAYLAGELQRRLGHQQLALEFFQRAINDGELLNDEELGPEGDLDLLTLSRRQRAELVHGHDDSPTLAAVARDGASEVRPEAARILALRQDKESLALLSEVWPGLDEQGQILVLQAFATKPHAQHSPWLLKALQSRNAESVRLAAQSLGALRCQEHIPALLSALRRAILTTEAALVDAIRRIGGPDAADGVARILEDWEQAADKQRWTFSNDLCPLRSFLYRTGEGRGLELLLRDMERLGDNDLWDKPPFGSPIAAAASLGERLVEILPAMLASANPATRRWAAHLVHELALSSLTEAVQPLAQDSELVVRLQAAKTLASLGEEVPVRPVLEALGTLEEGELPFALHFLTGFHDPAVREFLLQALDSGQATAGEILPLLGRQEPNQALNTLIQSSLSSKDDDTRAGAITAMAFQASPDLASRLIERFGAESNETVRRRILYGLARVSDSSQHDAREFLARQLAGPEPFRFPAALSLLYLNDDRGLELVRQRAAAVDESFDHYDFVAPAIKVLARYEKSRAPENPAGLAS